MEDVDEDMFKHAALVQKRERAQQQEEEEEEDGGIGVGGDGGVKETMETNGTTGNGKDGNGKIDEGDASRRKRRKRWDAEKDDPDRSTTSHAVSNNGSSVKRKFEESSSLVNNGTSQLASSHAAVASLSALEKAKAALKKQKELQEKLKKVTATNAAAAASLVQPTEKMKEFAQPQLQKILQDASMPVIPGSIGKETSNVNNQITKQDNEEEDPFYDERMVQRTVAARQPRSFQFYEPGELIEEAEKQRRMRSILKKQREGEGEKEGVASLLTGPLGGIYGEIAPPDVEWWDEMLMRGNYDAIDAKDGIVREKMTIYVEHPVPIDPPAEAPPPPPQPLILTKKERKKLRTQRRMAMEKERQEMIRQGLLDPPKSKVKLSNMMRVLGESATADPTAVEAAVRAETMERQQAHDDRNLANKLTPAERKAKKDAKLHSDTSLEKLVAVYRLIHIRSGKQKFLIEINASENRLTGRIVRTPKFVVVVVEGGSKGIKRFHKLMMNRIKWEDVGDDILEDDDEADEAGGNADRVPNSCHSVWTGSVINAAFSDFKYERCSTDYWASKVFKDAGVLQYYNMAQHHVPES